MEINFGFEIESIAGVSVDALTKSAEESKGDAE
jgi:hypothetical protein